jgi:hypothetical protein
VASTDTAAQLAIVVPSALKATFPEGSTGERELAASCAVKVTEVFTFVALEGEAVKLSVAGSGSMIWFTGLPDDVALYVASPL